MVDVYAQRPQVLADRVRAVALGEPTGEVVVRTRRAGRVRAAKPRRRPGRVDALALVVDPRADLMHAHSRVEVGQAVGPARGDHRRAPARVEAQEVDAGPAVDL